MDHRWLIDLRGTATRVYTTPDESNPAAEGTRTPSLRQVPYKFVQFVTICVTLATAIVLKRHRLAGYPVFVPPPRMSSSSSGPLTRLNPNRDTDTAKDILTVLEGDVCGRGR